MDEHDNFTETIHEQSNEHAREILHANTVREKWIMFVALSTALIAVLAAITGLLASNHSDAEMLAQMHSSDDWAFYEAKGIKADLLTSSNRLSVIMGEGSDTSAAANVVRLKKQQKNEMRKAVQFEKLSDMHAYRHDILARGVTLFQIAIAIGAISIIVKRKSLWFVSLAFASIGVFFLMQELMI